MKKTWKCSSVEIFHSAIPLEEYNQTLDEVAEIVYRHFCQLLEISHEAPETFIERTGTDG